MKIYTLKQIEKDSKNFKEQGKSIGLVVGSFDVCHLGHVNLFTLAKEYVDVLYVGLDHDESIRITKGSGRPINNWERRSKFLEHFSLIDGVFLIDIVAQHGSTKAQSTYEKLLKKVSPTHIFTHQICDRHWENKKNIADSLGITVVFDSSDRINNSGSIIDAIEIEL